MRTITCARLGAAALWPLLARGAAAIADPTDAAAPAPIPTTLSAFDYRPYREDESPDWRRLNAAALEEPKSGSTTPSRSRDGQHGGSPR